MRRNTIATSLAAAALIAVGLSAPLAHADPVPPYGCAANAFWDYTGSWATCQYGHGFYRAVVNCVSEETLKKERRYGPWKSAPGNTSQAWCSSGYYATSWGYETRPL